MVNKDFLRLIISGEKELIPSESIKMIDVPNYDELSVSNLWHKLFCVARYARVFTILEHFAGMANTG